MDQEIKVDSWEDFMTALRAGKFTPETVIRIWWTYNPDIQKQLREAGLPEATVTRRYDSELVVLCYACVKDINEDHFFDRYNVDQELADASHLAVLWTSDALIRLMPKYQGGPVRMVCPRNTITIHKLVIPAFAEGTGEQQFTKHAHSLITAVCVSSPQW